MMDGCRIALYESELLTQILRDAFAGGFVAGIVEGKPLDECVDMGHWLASLSIKELGPQYISLPLLLKIPSTQINENKEHNKTHFSSATRIAQKKLLLIPPFPTHRYPTPKQTFESTSN